MPPGRKRRKTQHTPDAREDEAAQESEPVIAKSPEAREDKTDNEGVEAVLDEEQEQWEAFREEQFEGKLLNILFIIFALKLPH